MLSEIHKHIRSSRSRTIPAELVSLFKSWINELLNFNPWSLSKHLWSLARVWPLWIKSTLQIPKTEIEDSVLGNPNNPLVKNKTTKGLNPFSFEACEFRPIPLSQGRSSSSLNSHKERCVVEKRSQRWCVRTRELCVFVLAEFLLYL